MLLFIFDLYIKYRKYWPANSVNLKLILVHDNALYEFLPINLGTSFVFSSSP